MVEANISIKDRQTRFTVGDTVSGIAHLNLPKPFSISNVSILFQCLGEVKWIEYLGTAHPQTYYDEMEFLHDELKWTEKGNWGMFGIFICPFCSLSQIVPSMFPQSWHCTRFNAI